MQELRRKFIDHLRNNPDKRDRIEHGLTDDKNGRCAMGLGLEGIGVDLGGSDSDNTPYERGAELLGFSYTGICSVDDEPFDLVWRLNDSGFDFEEIADILEEEWA